MIIDSHTHLTLKKAEPFDINIQHLLDAMDNTGIDKACIMVRTEEQMRHYMWTEGNINDTANSMVEAIKKYPGRFYTLLWIHPAMPNEYNIKAIEKYVVYGPIDGIKLHIEMNARDKRLEPLAEFMQSYDIPLLFHSWYKTVNKSQYESNPSDIANLAARFPKLRIIMAHLMGCRKRGIQDIKKHENVLVDTSGSQPEDGYLEYAINQLGPERVVFGSDYPGREIATQLGKIFALDLSDDTKDKLLYKNAVSFFRKRGEYK